MIHVETNEKGECVTTVNGYGPRILAELACVISQVKEILSEDMSPEHVNELLTSVFYLGMTGEGERKEEADDNTGI